MRHLAWNADFSSQHIKVLSIQHSSAFLFVFSSHNVVTQKGAPDLNVCQVHGAQLYRNAAAACGLRRLDALGGPESVAGLVDLLVFASASRGASEEEVGLQSWAAACRAGWDVAG